jgi:hypothetical protein
MPCIPCCIMLHMKVFYNRWIIFVRAPSYCIPPKLIHITRQVQLPPKSPHMNSTKAPRKYEKSTYTQFPVSVRHPMGRQKRENDPFNTYPTSKLNHITHPPRPTRQYGDEWILLVRVIAMVAHQEQFIRLIICNALGIRLNDNQQQCCQSLPGVFYSGHSWDGLGEEILLSTTLVAKGK